MQERAWSGSKLAGRVKFGTARRTCGGCGPCRVCCRVARELIEQQKDEIYANAAVNAKERVKLAFLVGRIATQEKIQATQEDVVKRAQQLAMMYQIPFEQFVKDLQKRDGINELYEQVLHEKVLELLEKNAALTEGAAAK